MSYLFNTPDETAEMLKEIGVDSIDALFNQIPKDLQLGRPLNLHAGMSEPELEAFIRNTADLGGVTSCFKGGGAYDHFIPSAIDEIVSRGEFYTAYTPYQAEASQGTLQAFYEYQTLICQLTGMEVSNASLYEGATAVSEAVFMAMRVTNRHQKIVFLGTVHPETLQVIKTYTSRLGCEICIVPIKNGIVDPEEAAKYLDDQTACLVIQQPNFFGCLEEVEPLVEAAKQVGALSVLSFDPISMGMLKRPGDYGVDIAVAEGQSLGTPLQYGGPYLGILACKKKYVRKMPGRLVGTAKDRNGKDCFVLNLQAREQHIRRDKATSNICTNQGLLALRATVYLTLLGPQGLKELAELCFQKAHYAAKQIEQLPDFELMFDAPFFKEFTIRVPGDPQKTISNLSDIGVGIGPALNQFHFQGCGQDLDNQDVESGILVAVTEQRSKSEIDTLVQELEDPFDFDSAAEEFLNSEQS